MMMDTEQEKNDNSPPSGKASSSSVEEVIQKVESAQLEGEPVSDNNEKLNAEMGLDYYKKRVEHLEGVLSDKHKVLDDLTKKFNDTTIKLQQLEKANTPLAKDKTDITSSNRHPGGDLCASPLVNDVSLHREMQKKEYRIAELQGYAMEYYNMVMQANKGKDDLAKQLRHSTSLNNKLKLQVNDLVQEKDVLYSKLSDTQSNLEEVMKERDLLKGKQFACSPPQVPDPATNIEQFKAELHKLKTLNEKLTREKNDSKRHIKEQEEKIEKLTIRCGRAEEDLKKVSLNKDGRHHQPTDENNDWRFKSLDDKDAKISELSRIISQQCETISELDKKLQLQEYNTKDSNESFFIKEQLKAFQDDYHAERKEKERILEEQHELREKNVVLMQRLYESQFSNDRGGQYPPPMPLAHNHNPHIRQYTPAQPRRAEGNREDLAYHNPNRPPTHLPGPPHRTTIPPRGNPQEAHHLQRGYYHLPNPHEAPRGGGNQDILNRGPLHDPH